MNSDLCGGTGWVVGFWLGRGTAVKEYDPEFLKLLQKLVAQSVQDLFYGKTAENPMACMGYYRVDYRWRDTEADGSCCDDCGDMVFLKARVMERKDSFPKEGPWERLLFVCASCADCRENTLEGA